METPTKEFFNRHGIFHQPRRFANSEAVEKLKSVAPTPIAALGLLLFAIGGLPFLLWGIFLRTVVGLHATWLVNSATHIWGSRPFSTRDDSTNNSLLF